MAALRGDISFRYLKQFFLVITTVLKVETYIITSIVASPSGHAVIQVIMYIETFIADAIFFNCFFKYYKLTNHRLIYKIKQTIKLCIH